MPSYTRSHLQYFGSPYAVPQSLPKRYTDDSIIPAIIINVIPSPSSESEAKKHGRRSSFIHKLKGKAKDESEAKGITKVVFMPRREYLKYFARGLKGEYVGTEPERRWTEQELDERFVEYKPVVKEGKIRYRAPY
jgi:hypothetical protein